MLRSYIAASLNNISTELTDSLGLRYPAIALRTPMNFEVQSLVMRSVFEYQIVQTGNVVEIAIYREWPGCDTRGVPTTEASVSMLHPNWEDEMQSIEHMTTSERSWDRDMINFFGKEESTERRAGLPALFADVREVQRLLAVGTAELAAAAAQEEREQEEEEYINSQIQQLEQDEAEKRTQEITKKSGEENNAVNKPATVVTPISTKPTTEPSFVGYIGNFDHKPGPDGSLI